MIGIRPAVVEARSRIAETLNNRPRKRLGFRTPNEVYYDPSNFALQT
jgi:IS30 family transposase